MLSITVKAHKIVHMKDLQPLQFGILLDGDSAGHIVLRTATTKSTKFEVIDLTTPGPDCCWVIPNSLRVMLLPKLHLILNQQLTDPLNTLQ